MEKILSIKNISKFIGCMFVTSTIGVADVWFDETGDIATGDSNLDITSFEITDDGQDLTMTLTVADLNADWGNYMIFMDFPAWPNSYPGSGDNDNPWGRNVSGLEGTDAFIGSWLSGGGGNQYYEYQSQHSGWYNFPSSPYSMSVDWSNSSITWIIEDWVATWVNEGYEGFNFEVGTTGGNWGDPAIDLLNGTGGNWGEGSTGAWEYYQFSTVPSPGALVLLTIAGFSRKRRI